MVLLVELRAVRAVLHRLGAGGFVGWWLLMWGVFTFYMWLGSLALNRAVQLVFLALWITFFLLSAADLLAMPLLHVAGGYTGLVTAMLAFYLAAAEVINETHGRSVLPIGAPGVSSSAGLRRQTA